MKERHKIFKLCSCVHLIFGKGDWLPLKHWERQQAGDSAEYREYGDEHCDGNSGSTVCDPVPPFGNGGGGHICENNLPSAQKRVTGKLKCQNAISVNYTSGGALLKRETTIQASESH